MKIKKRFILLSVIEALLLILTGCGQNESPETVNQLSFSTKGIHEITISYDDEDIAFYESNSDNLIVKEYMNINKNKYHARVSQSKDSIKISEGSKPFSKDGFIRYIEVYLPSSYNQKLKVTSTNGNVTVCEVSLNLDNLRIDCVSGKLELKKAKCASIHLSSTSGKLELGSLIAQQIRIDVTNGNVICKRAQGNISYTSTGGDAEFLCAVGCGTFRANNSGMLSVAYDKVSGNLSLFNKNDSVKLVLPENLSFEFEAITKNGSISTNFESDLSIKGNTANGIIGKNPNVKVAVETKNGDIEVSK